MHIHHLGEKNSVLNHFIAEIRDINVQKDRMRFRKNMERIGEIMSYELSKTLNYESRNVSTPLGEKASSFISNDIVICSILRAGLSLHHGLLNYFDGSDNCFISAYRHHHSETEFEIVVEYLASPSLEGKTVLLADPMLATGQSFLSVYDALKPMGKPKEVHLLSTIAAPEGIAYLEKNLPKDTHLWVAAIDERLNNKGYIIPGLGDAGDLAYGTKLQN
ncbi:uracil phosphoribosyltransferase [Leptobacterium flavescens]|uniref:Uracil phosphoribosyltransferase n=1 Tax=Leptobacterium flavescens TaxID=472055 RepID=A0A6P0UJ37_9FLAO|nr:uracil phosphoribosyltransferase [Leptobacterium flavescens]NER13234.1 uracil phosphoribosyltransferase [Leptobacterium flavescens]